MVRHGECTANRSFVVIGQKDYALTRNGRRQAMLLAKALRDAGRFEAIYSSDLSRARSTAHIISEQLRMDVVFEEGLRERRLGSLEGKKHEQIEREFAHLLSAFRETGSLDHIPHAEADTDFLERLRSTVQHIIENHVSGRVILVTHSGWINLFFALFLGQTPPEFPKNCSISRFCLTHEGWRVFAYNEVGHLV